eukprot:289942-Rhodomonas_salina.1
MLSSASRCSAHPLASAPRRRLLRRFLCSSARSTRALCRRSTLHARKTSPTFRPRQKTGRSRGLSHPSTRPAEVCCSLRSALRRPPRCPRPRARATRAGTRRSLSPKRQRSGPCASSRRRLWSRGARSL